MINPVVDPVPPTNHRVITTVLCDATMPKVPKIVPARRDRNPAIIRTGSLRFSCMAVSFPGGGNVYYKAASRLGTQNIWLKDRKYGNIRSGGREHNGRYHA